MVSNRYINEISQFNLFNLGSLTLQMRLDSYIAIL